MDRFVDTVGLCGIAGARDAATRVALGLEALGHRGELDRRIVASEGLTAAPDAPLRPGLAIGEVHGQPPAEGLGGEAGEERLVVGRVRDRWVAVALAGRLTNGARLSEELTSGGAVLQTRTDAELLLHLIATSSQRRFVNCVVDALWRVEGAYSLLVLTSELLLAVRDPAGFRPLVLGRLNEAALVATEDAAVVAAGGEVRRPVQAGELLVLDGRGVQSVSPFPGRPPSACVQELVALAAPDAAPFGIAVAEARAALARRLAEVAPCPGAEVVCGVPGYEQVALAWAEAAGLPLRAALVVVCGGSDGLDDVRGPRWRAVTAAVRGLAVVLVAPSVTTGAASKRRSTRSTARARAGWTCGSPRRRRARRVRTAWPARPPRRCGRTAAARWGRPRPRRSRPPTCASSWARAIPPSTACATPA
ncbi:MAG: hypothetical protein R3F59_16275 [Myxococcota bacterium]